MDRPFLQTPDWLAFQKSLGRQVWRLDDGFIKANLIRHNTRLGQNFLYLPYGPELNIELAKDGLRNEIGHFSAFLRGLMRDQKSMFVKIEPTHDLVVELLQRNGLKLRKSLRAIQPNRTVVVDLVQDREGLFNQLHHKHRYNINLAERKGVTVESSTDSEVFWRMLKLTSQRDGFRLHDHLYYSRLLNFFNTPDGQLRVKMYFAYYGGAPIAGAILMEHGQTVHYLHGASVYDQRAIMAPHFLHWSLILRYKENGYKNYDFWGINSIKWPGVTRFKLGFGGKVLEYPGSFDLVRRSLWHWLYNHAPGR